MMSLKEKLEMYQAHIDKPWSIVAKNLDYSAAVISQCRKGSYTGDTTKVEAKLDEYLANIQAEKEVASLSNSVGYVATSISTAVYDNIRLCHLKGGFAIEAGDAGIGKTMACKKYAEDHPATAYYVPINPCISGITSLLRQLCTEMSLQQGNRYDMWLRIAHKLSGESKVLILDEAQHLPLKTLDSLRAFFDAYPEIGICLVGNAELVTKLRNKNTAVAQIKNRTKTTIIRHTADITKTDIELLFPGLVGKEKETEFLLKIAQTDNAIRGAQNLYSNAVDNNNTTYAGLVLTAKKIMQEV